MTIETFLRSLRDLPENSWIQISRDLPSWELWWEEAVGDHLTDQAYLDAVLAAGLRDPDHLVRAVAEACSAERRAEANEREEHSWHVVQAELSDVALGRGVPNADALREAGTLRFERFDWETAVSAAVRAARALVLGRRISEDDSNYALSPLRHIISIPDYEDLT